MGNCMQDLDQFRLSDAVIAIIDGPINEWAGMCQLWNGMAFIRDWAKKARQPVLVAAPCLFVQLAHL